MHMHVINISNCLLSNFSVSMIDSKFGKSSTKEYTHAYINNKLFTKEIFNRSLRLHWLLLEHISLVLSIQRAYRENNTNYIHLENPNDFKL